LGQRQIKGDRSRNKSIDQWQRKVLERRNGENQFRHNERQHDDRNWACLEKQAAFGRDNGKELVASGRDSGKEQVAAGCKSGKEKYGR
ncbi:hypothetical protein L195_g063004, partial [Trifolium pratense]